MNTVTLKVKSLLHCFRSETLKFEGYGKGSGKFGRIPQAAGGEESASKRAAATQAAGEAGAAYAKAQALKAAKAESVPAPKTGPGGTAKVTSRSGLTNPRLEARLAEIRAGKTTSKGVDPTSPTAVKLNPAALKRAKEESVPTPEGKPPSEMKEIAPGISITKSKDALHAERAGKDADLASENVHGSEQGSLNHTWAAGLHETASKMAESAGLKDLADKHYAKYVEHHELSKSPMSKKAT